MVYNHRAGQLLSLSRKQQVTTIYAVNLTDPADVRGEAPVSIGPHRVVLDLP